MELLSRTIRHCRQHLVTTGALPEIAETNKEISSELQASYRAIKKRTENLIAQSPVEELTELLDGKSYAFGWTYTGSENPYISHFGDLDQLNSSFGKSFITI